MENIKGPTRGNGKICYMEIPSDDIQQSAAFYKALFEWTIRQEGNGNASFDDAVNEVSGAWVIGRRAATNIGLLVSIMVYSIGQTLESVLANGGTIIQPPENDPSGKTALFADPTGNIFCLYQSSQKK
jgi:hypothetical protein